MWKSVCLGVCVRIYKMITFCFWKFKDPNFVLQMSKILWPYLIKPPVIIPLLLSAEIPRLVRWHSCFQWRGRGAAHMRK